MNAMDDADRLTAEALEAVEARITRVYAQAAAELADRAAEHWRELPERDAAMRQRVARCEMTESAYRDWLRGQLLTGQVNEDLRDAVAREITDKNLWAADHVNDWSEDVFAFNRNYAAYGLESTYGSLSFTLYDKETVRRLLEESPELLPEISERLAIDIPVDLRWNREKIVEVVTSAILQGKSIPDIARDMGIVVGMNRTSAIRNARTAITAAQNGGRMSAYRQAAAAGIDVHKRWITTKDTRTRDSHKEMDGVELPYNEVFVTPLGSEMEYPGDPAGKPGDVYNCRCSMRTVEKAGIEAEARMVRVRDPATGKNVVVRDMTYRQWERWVKSRG